MLVLIPILAMLALEFIVPSKKKPSVKMLLSIICGGFIFLVVMRLLLPTAWIYPEAETVVRVRWQVDHLLKTKEWQKKPVLIFEGSSATEYGINGRALEQMLAKRGIPVTVIQFSLPGANHFERLFMLQLFLEELGKKHCEELAAAPTLLFNEVFDAYDQDPLYLFKKEAYSLRTIQWLHPWNALIAWKAAHVNDGTKNDISSWTLLEHLLLNHFSVGIFSSLEPLNYKKKMNAFCPLNGTKKTFNYTKTAQEFEASLLLPPATNALKIPSTGWHVYYKELYEELGGICHSLVFYALPTLEPQRRAYQVAFAEHLPSTTTLLGPASPDFMKALLREGNWFDGVHPQGAGAILFTTWMAEEIAEHWSQILATRWKVE